MLSADITKVFVFSWCLLENNSCRVYRDSEQSHDDAYYRSAVLPAKVCPAEDETTRCKYSVTPVFPEIRAAKKFEGTNFFFMCMFTCSISLGFWHLLFADQWWFLDTFCSQTITVLPSVISDNLHILRCNLLTNSPAWYNIDLHVLIISNNTTNNHLIMMGLTWLETMKVNILAGGEDTAAPLTLFQDHPRLSSRSPHAASTQRKTYNWVINYTTNKTPSWYLPPLVFLLLFEAAFRTFSSSMVVACWFVAEGTGVEK